MARPNHDTKHLTALQDYYARHRLIPSYSAISALLGFSAKNAAAALVRRLEEAGYLRRTPDRRLTPTERFENHRQGIKGEIFAQPERVAFVFELGPEFALHEAFNHANDQRAQIFTAAGSPEFARRVVGGW